MRYHAKAVINAPLDKVWDILENNPSKGEEMPMKLAHIEPYKKMVWTRLLPFGAFRRVRTLELLAKDDMTCEIHVEEIFSGVLLPLFKSSLPNMDDSLSSFVLGLKKLVEMEKN